MKRVIHVVGAVIIRDGLVFCVQRGPDGSLPGMWEFPGGKVESDETPREALAREIGEELRCQVDVGELVTTTAHTYDFGVVELTTYYCQLTDGVPELVEHAQMAWCSLAELQALDWAPADLPAVDLVTAKLAEPRRV